MNFIRRPRRFIDLRRPGSERPPTARFSRRFIVSSAMLASCLFVVAGLILFYGGGAWLVRGGEGILRGQTATSEVNTEIAGREAGPLDPNIYHVPGAPYARGLSFIFFADGYLSWDEFDRDADVVMRGLKSVPPWQLFSRFNIYKVKPRENDICSVKVANERKPVLRCDPALLNGYLNRLTAIGPFKLVVLSRRDFQSWANIARLGDSGIFFSIPVAPSGPSGEAELAIPFAHMIGHAFGLKDEELFVIAQADSAGNTAGGPNCAPDKTTAERWWGDVARQYPDRVGYFPGCAGHGEYIGPHRGSIMNLGDLSHFVPDYGPVSERYLGKVLNYCFSEKRYAASDDPQFFEQYPEFAECIQ
jgi:hypothetical protein